MKSHLTTKPGLFAHHGDIEEMAAIREALDVGAPMPSARKVLSLGCLLTDPKSVAATLLDFFQSIEQPLFGSSFVAALQKWDEKANIRLLDLLPTCHANLFLYMVSFLRLVLGHQSKNGLFEDTVGTLFFSVFARTRDRAIVRKGSSVLLQFIRKR